MAFFEKFKRAGSFVKEKYDKHYGVKGAQERAENYKLKEMEYRARARYNKARAEAYQTSKTKQGGFADNFSFVTGRKENPDLSHLVGNHAKKGKNNYSHLFK